MSDGGDDDEPRSYHEVYGVVLASNRPIGLLPARPPTPPRLTVRWQDGPHGLSGRSWFRHWARDDGSTVFRAARTPSGGYLVDFPDLATFELDGTGQEISVGRPAETSMAEAESLLVDQVVPRVLAQRHDLVFHGSAVDIGGTAIVFMGPSGRGKSTLAAALGARGHPVLSDDCVRFGHRGAGETELVIHPAYAGLRLWSDSLRAVTRSGPDGPDIPGDRIKRRFADTSAMAFAGRPTPVGHVLFLAPGRGDDPQVRVEPLVGAAVIGELVGCQFLLDHTDEAEVQASFAAAALLGRTTPCGRLHLPRDLDALDRHAARLLELLDPADA